MDGGTLARVVGASTAAAWVALASAAAPPNPMRDLSGIWNYATMTPLERPREFAERETLTAEEAARYERADLRTAGEHEQHGRTRLVGSGHAPPDGSAHVAHRRSGERPAAAADRRRAATRGRARRGAAPAARRRRARRSRAQRALPALVGRGAADAAGRLQQQRAVHPDARLRRHLQRDDSRRAHRADGWPPARHDARGGWATRAATGSGTRSSSTR